MSGLWNGKTFEEVIEQNKLESREIYLKRQRMAEEQRNREAQFIQAFAKTEHEVAIERTKKLLSFLGTMVVGGPQFGEQTLFCMREIAAILEHLLKNQSIEEKSGDEDGR